MQRLVIDQESPLLKAKLARFSSAMPFLGMFIVAYTKKSLERRGVIVKLGSTRQMMTAPSPGVENSVPTTYWVGCA